MEKTITCTSGLGMFIFCLLLFVGGNAVAVLLLNMHQTEEIGALLMLASIIIPIPLFFGFFIVNPNDSKVLVLFGNYKGTVKKNGFYWATPFFSKQKITLRARNFESDRLKVNDKAGNPIIISVIVVWRVRNTFNAAFDVDDYVHFVRLQSDSALRFLCSQYAYDNFTDNEQELTLRSGTAEINEELERQLSQSLKMVGIDVIEARIGYLAYAPEIASAMLQRQQAEAVVAARFKIVEGAVGMVEETIRELADRKLSSDLTPEQKAEMIKNLMIVLCSDKETVPVVSLGS